MVKKDGSKDKLTVTEEQFAQVWPNVLKRKRMGCDFLDEKTENFVEVKSGVLRPEQISEMTAQFAAGKRPVLGVVNHHSVLVFTLEQIIPLPSELRDDMAEYQVQKSRLEELKKEAEQAEERRCKAALDEMTIQNKIANEKDRLLELKSAIDLLDDIYRKASIEQLRDVWKNNPILEATLGEQS